MFTDGVNGNEFWRWNSGEGEKLQHHRFVLRLIRLVILQPSGVMEAPDSKFEHVAGVVDDIDGMHSCRPASKCPLHFDACIIAKN